MENIYDLISGLKTNALKLIEKKDSIEAKNSQLSKDKIKLENIIDEQKTTINNIKDKNKLNIIAKSSNLKKDSKLKINEIVREIDKCIALLNN